MVKSTIICPPNDIETLGKVLEEDKDTACVILEPTGASFGIIPTYGEFLKQFLEITKQRGVLLVFDEVVTGFRCVPRGAQEYYNVLPELATLGKILGGGIPGATVAGREEILELIEIKTI